MPKYPFRTITTNGTEILIDPIPHVKSCSVGFWIKSGSCHENQKEEGLAHFVEHAVFKGTNNYSNPQLIAEAIDQLGGNLDAFTGKEVTCFYGKVLSQYLPNLISLLSDLIIAPVFNEIEVNKEKNVILEEINQSEDQPDDFINELFYANFWLNGPLSHSILGARGQISNYTCSQVKSFFQKNYIASNTLIVATGNIQVDQFMKILESTLKNLPSGTKTDIDNAVNKPKAFLLNVHRNELQQANLVMGFPAYPHKHPNLMATNLLSYALGGSMASRLFMELREKYALCYQIGSYVNQYSDTGALQIMASCAPEHIKELVQRAVLVFSEIRKNGLTNNELERAKLQFKTNLAFSQESTINRMFSLANQAIYNNKILSLDEQIIDIDNVKLDKINEISAEIFNLDNFGLSILGTNDNIKIQQADLV